MHINKKTAWNILSGLFYLVALFITGAIAMATLACTTTHAIVAIGALARAIAVMTRARATAIMTAGALA